jgi:CheY-like chemotaxis protein
MMNDPSPSSPPVSGTVPRIPRVLVIDDDALVARALRRVLSDEFDVSATTRPLDALEWLTSGDWYDVILCDVEMPAMDGLVLRDLIAASRPDLAARIVFLTGGWHPRLDSVPNLVLAKPLDTDPLRALIRRRTREEPVARRAS